MTEELPFPPNPVQLKVKVRVLFVNPEAVPGLVPPLIAAGAPSKVQEVAFATFPQDNVYGE